MTQSPQQPRSGTPKGLIVAGCLFLGVVAGIGALYGMKGKPGNSAVAMPDAAMCESSKIKAEKLAAVTRGEIAALKIRC